MIYLKRTRELLPHLMQNEALNRFIHSSGLDAKNMAIVVHPRYNKRRHDGYVASVHHFTQARSEYTRPIRESVSLMANDCYGYMTRLDPRWNAHLDGVAKRAAEDEMYRHCDRIDAWASKHQSLFFTIQKRGNKTPQVVHPSLRKLMVLTHVVEDLDAEQFATTIHAPQY